MIKKKICMLGSPGVGKTSLVRQFVQSVFSDKYLATVGVRIDQKIIPVGQEQMGLLLWDMEGLTDLRTLQSAYLRGAAGYLLVADGTKPETLETVVRLQKQIEELLGKVPFGLASTSGTSPATGERMPTVSEFWRRTDGISSARARRRARTSSRPSRTSPRVCCREAYRRLIAYAA